jgi:hypothetical protein
MRSPWNLSSCNVGVIGPENKLFALIGMSAMGQKATFGGVPTTFRN